MFGGAESFPSSFAKVFESCSQELADGRGDGSGDPGGGGEEAEKSSSKSSSIAVAVAPANAAAAFAANAHPAHGASACDGPLRAVVCMYLIAV